MKRGSIFELNGIPKFQEALPLALQHVVAMIVGCVTPAIIVAGAVGGNSLSAKDRVILIQASLVVSALSTLIQLFPIGKKNGFTLGSGLPMIMGVSFAYVPSMQAIAEGYGISSILGAQIIGGIVAFVMGILVKKIRVFFPPLITGTVVFTIGLSLYPTAINYMAAELGGCFSDSCRCYCTESFWKGNPEACFDTDRYSRRICGVDSFWNGKSFKCRRSKSISASTVYAFWNPF